MFACGMSLKIVVSSIDSAFNDASALLKSHSNDPEKRRRGVSGDKHKVESDIILPDSVRFNHHIRFFPNDPGG